MRILLTLLSVTFLFTGFAQDCLANISYILKNMSTGGFYSGQPVTLTSLADGKTYTGKTDANGKVTFSVPCEQEFTVFIDNYADEEKTRSGKEKSSSTQTLGYSPDMREKDKIFAMNADQIAALNKRFGSLPDTSVLSATRVPANPDDFEFFTLTIKNLEDQPLANENVIITGATRKKHFKGRTDATGELVGYIPKGDSYTINFKYHPAYRDFKSDAKIGTSKSRVTLTYMGTIEYLRRKKEEEERIKAEEARVAAERKAMEDRAKRAKISIKEAYMADLQGPVEDNMIDKIFKRNKWSEKLIVCDLTGSMSPYAQQLLAWYKLSYKLENNLQFVFFNDGDQKSDSEKKIGSTGGIYLQKAKGVDALVDLMATVVSKGDGGDCPENNMEALIQGVQKSDPYKELIMIADNEAPVKDIELLKQFNRPVHIIICGSDGGVHPDYLKIAWKTKGSIHTMEQDLMRLASLSEGQTITIGSTTYKILGGEFVALRKS